MLGHRQHRRTAAVGAVTLATLSLMACTPDGQAPLPEPTSPAASSTDSTSPSASPTATPGPSAGSPGDPGEQTSEPAAPITEIPAVPDAETNAQGDVLKGLGQDAELLNGDGEVVATVTVHGTEVLTSCPGEFAVAPYAGSYVVADVSAAMTDAAAPDALLLVGPAMWRIVGPDGQVTADLETDAAWQCFQTEERLPNFVGPGEEVRGRLVLDSDVTTGQLIFSPTGGKGWSWALD